MKIIRILSFALLGLLLGASSAVAQLRLPGTSQQKVVTWKTQAVAADSGYIDLVLTASIASEWHMYSMSLPEGGPNPTTFTFTESPDYQLVGKPTETGIVQSGSHIFFGQCGLYPTDSPAGGCSIHRQCIGRVPNLLCHPLRGE